MSAQRSLSSSDAKPILSDVPYFGSLQKAVESLESFYVRQILYNGFKTLGISIGRKKCRYFMALEDPRTWVLCNKRFWRGILLVQIPKGAWFIQNAANSEVGLMMVALCKSRGIKTINIVRRQEAADLVKSSG